MRGCLKPKLTHAAVEPACSYCRGLLVLCGLCCGGFVVVLLGGCVGGVVCLICWVVCSLGALW